MDVFSKGPKSGKACDGERSELGAYGIAQWSGGGAQNDGPRGRQTGECELDRLKGQCNECDPKAEQPKSTQRGLVSSTEPIYEVQSH